MNKLLFITSQAVSTKVRKVFTAITTACALGFSQTLAAAVYSGDSVEMYLNKNTFPSGLVEEKIFLGLDLSSEISGNVGSRHDPRLVTFSSTTDILATANGFATIKAVDGMLNSITITAPGYLFEDIIFSLNLVSGSDTRPNSNEDLVISTADKSGNVDIFSDWTAQADWVNGNNSILMLATDGNLIKSVTITSQDGMTSIGGIQQIKQFEISGLTAVPVPAALWLFGSGLIGLISIAIRNKV